MKVCIRVEKTYLKVDELDGAGLDHGPHGIHQVVHQGVDPALLVERNGAHGLLAHSALVRVPAHARALGVFITCVLTNQSGSAG